MWVIHPVAVMTNYATAYGYAFLSSIAALTVLLVVVTAQYMQTLFLKCLYTFTDLK